MSSTHPPADAREALFRRHLRAVGDAPLLTAEQELAAAADVAAGRAAENELAALGGTGVTDKTVVEQVFREVRAFRIYDGPTEVHKWSLAKKIKRDWKTAQGC